MKRQAWPRRLLQPSGPQERRFPWPEQTRKRVQRRRRFRERFRKRSRVQPSWAAWSGLRRARRAARNPQPALAAQAFAGRPAFLAAWLLPGQAGRLQPGGAHPALRANGVFRQLRLPGGAAARRGGALLPRGGQLQPRQSLATREQRPQQVLQPRQRGRVKVFGARRPARHRA